MLNRSMPMSARRPPRNRMTLAKRRSNWLTRGPNSCPCVSRLTFVVPVASAPAGKRPSVVWTGPPAAFGRFHVAPRDAPFVAEFDPIPMFALGTDRMLALTRTSILGTTYDVNALNDVWNGSVMSHELIGWFNPRNGVSASGSAAYSAQVLI